MLFTAKEDLATHLKGSASLTNGHVELNDAEKFQNSALDDLVKNAVLNENIK